MGKVKSLRDCGREDGGFELENRWRIGNELRG
jgi:hypothetical protein